MDVWDLLIHRGSGIASLEDLFWGDRDGTGQPEDLNRAERYAQVWSGVAVWLVSQQL
jgi:hypothetical protein